MSNELPPPFPAPGAVDPGQKWKCMACFFPLLALGLEMAWCVFLFMALIFIVGDTPYTNTEAKSRVFDFIASFPVVAGLIVGVIALVQKWPARPRDWICLIVGTIFCALGSLCFLWGLIN